MEFFIVKACPPVRLRYLALGLLASCGLAWAQGFKIQQTTLRPDGKLEVTFPAQAGSYHRLLMGSSPTTVAQPVAVTAGGTLLTRQAVADKTGFFRVERVADSASYDTDGDLIPDTYELARPGQLDALDAADAGKDPDNNGKTSLQEYLETQGEQRQSVKIIESSPLPGEYGVAVTRETVV